MPGVSLVSVGIRAISTAEVAFYEANRDRITIHWANEQARWDIEAIVAPLRGRPVYVTFDIDALDGAVMPATGTPTPGGLGYLQALAILRRACAAAATWSAPTWSSSRPSRACTPTTTPPPRWPTRCWLVCAGRPAVPDRPEERWLSQRRAAMPLAPVGC